MAENKLTMIGFLLTKTIKNSRFDKSTSANNSWAQEREAFLGCKIPCYSLLYSRDISRWHTNNSAYSNS